ncbi:hypothetical protein LCGC14_2968150 [marine sediment metagenome]|uniref:Uncharacterized protein n=1 Tax=marine sediment metagenome TaxID=412755 RepID=A0A0F9A1F5_9ZZZZ
MESPLNQLKSRILGRKGKSSKTELTNMLFMVREFGCLGELIGRDFEVRDPKGKLVFTIRQKPMAISQMNKLLKEFGPLKQLDREIEEKKWGTKNKGRKH